jgi:hypothetical protein
MNDMTDKEWLAWRKQLVRQTKSSRSPAWYFAWAAFFAVVAFFSWIVLIVLMVNMWSTNGIR